MKSFLIAGLLLSSLAASSAANWQSTVTHDPPGSFPEPRPLRATYNFGWSGITAATAEARFNKSSDDRFQLDATGRTIGVTRALWRYDVDFHAVSDARTLRPVETTQNEIIRTKKVSTHLAFNGSGVTRSRSENGTPVKGKTFAFSNLYDLQSAMLYLRSEPLKDRSSYRVVVYPTTSPYLATVTVTGHEKINVRAGSYNAIKMDLQLSKIGNSFELQPHRKFRKATIWISDDPDRIILRVEAQIFVGTIFAELQAVKFDKA